LDRIVWIPHPLTAADVGHEALVQS